MPGNTTNNSMIVTSLAKDAEKKKQEAEQKKREKVAQERRDKEEGERKRREAATQNGTQNSIKGGKQNNAKGGTKNNPAQKPEPNKGKVQTAEGPEEFDVLPDAANLEAINAEYVPHIYSFNVNPETVHSVYGTADLKKIRMSLDEE